jgi:hypothetical protein
MKNQSFPLSDVTLIALSEITSVHPAISDIWDKIGRDAPATVHIKVDEQSILDAMELSPITLHQFSKKIYCLSGIDQYRLACMNLPKETLIPVRYFKGNKGDRFNRVITAELLTSQIVHLKPKFYYRWLYEIWRYISSNFIKINTLDCSANKSSFAKAFIIDSRGLND